jgi:hypothetical protein
MRLQSVKYDGKTYLLVPYPLNVMRFKMYSAQDTALRTQLGEVEFDPLTKRPSRVSVYSSS